MIRPALTGRGQSRAVHLQRNLSGLSHKDLNGWGQSRTLHLRRN
jgi:hypothetical protein